ncbi:hypothetical protein HY491_04790 [Candidatus Woesearchaeota archaeon]|nr:hypothetical protein [Candidatus Woesearchaeota archaeon]
MKGQISVEFMFAIGALVLFFLGILAIGAQKNTEIRNTRLQLEQEHACAQIAHAITQAYMSGDGTSLKMRVERTVTVRNDTSIFVDDTVRCRYLGVSSGFNGTGLLEVRNTNNKVVITNA